MNLGLGNRTSLKNWVLPEDERSGTEFDSALELIGLGVAAQLEKFCNRQFSYEAAAQTSFAADRLTFTLPRYPIVSIATLEIRYSMNEAWEDITDLIDNHQEKSGNVWFYGVLGRPQGTCRITWAGGYWFDETEDESGVQPVGSTALPADLSLAWLQQCAHVWEMRDKLGIPLGTDPEGASSALPAVTLLPSVKETLLDYRRFALS